jgi:hypothetical protein
MEASASEPKTFLEAIPYFQVPENCVNYLAKRRWPNGVECPTCGRKDAPYVASRRYWQCKTRHPKAQFSIKTGTIFEESPIGLYKWLPVLWQVGNCKNGVSSWEIHRNLGVTQKTAWFMLHRIRLAMQDDLTGGMMGGEVEIDESFIGGKVRNMHKDRKFRAQKEGGHKGGKSIVMGILERASEAKPKKVRATIISDRKKETMRAEIEPAVSTDAKVFSDNFGTDWNLHWKYDLQTANHLEKKVC